MSKVGLALVVTGLVLIANASPAGAAPGAGALFGTDANGAHLLRVDQGTGVGSLVGSLGAGVFPALAVDPTTGTMYAGQGAGSPVLFTVNTATGAASPVGDTGLGFAAIGDMDFSANGTLFAAVNLAGDGGSGSDHLAIIDKSTGAATVIGPFGSCTGVSIPTSGDGSCTIEGLEAIAFDLTGRLWGAVNSRTPSGAPGLYLIDTATGAATFQRPIVDDTGTPPSGGVVALRFSCTGALYGGTARAAEAAQDGGRLIRIDPGSGLFSFVSGASITEGSSLGALAFGAPCSAEPVPTLSGWAMIGLVVLMTAAGVGTLRRRRDTVGSGERPA